MSSTNQSDSSLTNYQYKGRLGITDLWSEDPWLSDFGNWPIFSAHFGVTEEEYEAYPDRYANRVRARNEQYLAELNASGRYGEEYIISVAVKPNPLFDEPKNNYLGKRPLESYRMILLDTEDYNGESNIKYK